MNKLPKTTKTQVNSVKQNLAQVIYDRRTSLGVTQESLANNIGVDRKTINRIENGHFSPNLDTLVRIFTALNIKSQSIFKTQ
jgi:DNA-binding XRE family transcriptional regulator